MFLLGPGSERERITTLLLLQAGRIATYSIAGGAVASVASLAIDPESTATTFRVLQYVAALGLMWIGLSTAGMLPRLAIPGTNASASLVTFLDPVIAPLRRHRILGPVALGLTWGLTPCPMVYASLFSAALTGSFAMGSLWMLGFGAGTLPGVLGAALGVSALQRLRKGPAAEMTAGLLITAFAFLTLYFGWPQSLFCATP